MKEVTPKLPPSFPPRMPETETKPFYKKTWFFIVIAVLAVAIILVAVFLKNSKKAEEQETVHKKPKTTSSYVWESGNKDRNNGGKAVEPGSLRDNFDDVPIDDEENTQIQINGVYGGQDRGPAEVKNGNAEVNPGNVFQYGDLQLAFIDADLDYRDYIESNNSFKKPQDKYMVTAVGLRNTGKGTIKVDSDEFICMADYEPCFDAAEEKFDVVELGPGESTTIYLIYLVPKNAEIIRIQYTPHYYKASSDAERVTFYVLESNR